MTEKGRYKANFTKGGLMVPESRLVADLLLRRVDAREWKRCIETENILRAKTVWTARSKVGVAKARLQTMTEPLWALVRDGSKPVAAHAVFAATIKFSPLIGDFLDLVVRRLFQKFEVELKPMHWDQFVEDCRSRDPDMPTWTQTTLDKLRTRTFRMLWETGYLADERSHRLQAVTISPEVMTYLRENNEHYVLRCIQVGP